MAVDIDAKSCVKFIIENTRIEVVPKEVLEDSLIKLCIHLRGPEIKSLLDRTSVNPACQGNLALEIAVLANAPRIVNILLSRPEVDPSFNDHQLLKVGWANVKINTIATLFSSAKFDPSAHDCIMVASLCESENLTDNISSLGFVLSHPNIDLHRLDSLLETPSNSKIVVEKKNIVRSMIPLLEAVRQGDFESVKSLDYKTLPQDSIRSMYFTSVTFNRPEIFEFLQQHMPENWWTHISVSLALRFDTIGVFELLFSKANSYQLQVSSKRVFNDCIEAAINSKAKKVLKYLFEQFKLRADKVFVRLLDGLTAQESGVLSRSVDLSLKYIEKEFTDEPSLSRFFMSIVGLSLIIAASTPHKGLVGMITDTFVTSSFLYHRIKFSI